MQSLSVLQMQKLLNAHSNVLNKLVWMEMATDLCEEVQGLLLAMWDTNIVQLEKTDQ